MAVKVVIFDLFETLILEFDSGRPSHTEVAQTLQLPMLTSDRNPRSQNRAFLISLTLFDVWGAVLCLLEL